MLEMRADCERCGVDLPASAPGAFICSFDCTYCADCADALDERCSNCGGELTDHATTGDGTIAALQLLAALVDSGKAASELLHQFDPVPQLLKNVRYTKGQKPLEADAVKTAIADGERDLAGTGRLVIRASGTEPLIRVMAEGDNAAQVKAVVERICDAVAGAVG
jgi:phosphoglucosamine mutase